MKRQKQPHGFSVGHAGHWLPVALLTLSAVATLGLPACGEGSAAGAINHEPIIVPPGGATLSAGDTLSLEIISSDPDGDTVTLELASGPAGTTLLAGELTWTPGVADVGVHILVLSATDDGVPALTVYAQVIVTVLGPEDPPNNPPIITPVANLTVSVGDPVVVTVDATDPDGDGVTLSLTSAPAGATLAGSTITWTPGTGDEGSHPFLMTAVDDGTLPQSAYGLFTVTVVGTVVPENHPPVLMPVGDRALMLGDTLQITLDATDPDGNAITYALASAPTGASLVGNVLTWIPAAGQEDQSYWLVVSATDDGVPALADYAGFTVTVDDPNAPEPNHAPVADPMAGQSVLVGDTLSFVVTAVDPDNDALTWQADFLPTGATFDATSGTFDWTPAAGTEGTFYAAFRVTDAGVPPLEDILMVPIQVVAPAGNMPPTWIGWPVAGSVSVCGAFSESFEAVDPDDDPLTYYAIGLPPGATFTPQGSTAVLEWAAGAVAPGIYTMQIVAQEDGTPGLQTTGYFNVEVTSPTTQNHNFTNLGTFSTPSLNEGTFAVTGSNDVNVLNLNGLGIVGGASSNTVDGSEWIEFTFDAPSQDISYFVNMAGQGGSGSLGQTSVEAWDANGVSLGTVLMTSTGTKLVSSDFGDVLISRFRISMLDNDLIRISRLEETVCP